MGVAENTAQGRGRRFLDERFLADDTARSEMPSCRMPLPRNASSTGGKARASPIMPSDIMACRFTAPSFMASIRPSTARASPIIPKAIVTSSRQLGPDPLT